MHPDPDPNNPTKPVCLGMCAANAHLQSASLALNDTPIGYAPSKGPPAFVRLTYNQLGATLPASPGFFNVGPKWTINLLSFIEDDPTTAGQKVTRFVAGGGFVDYASGAGSYDSATGLFGAEKVSHGILKRINTSGTISYEITFPDGSKQIFDKRDGATSYPRRVFLSQIVEPSGQALTLNYDTGLRLTTLTDATGRNTTFSYSGSDKKVVGITDPFGRSATLTYFTSGAATGQLASITDMIGITSSFTYDTAGDSTFISQLTTPYGNSTFAKGFDQTSGARWLELTDANGWTERLELLSGAPGIASSGESVPTGMTDLNGWLAQNNTFYWDKYAYPTYGTGSGKDYTKASRTVWLVNDFNEASSIPGAKKRPLEGYVFYNYPGQTNAGSEGSTSLPSKVGRVLPGGASQVTSYEHNAKGNITKVVDPSARETTYEYYSANNIDLHYVKQKNGSSSTTTVATYGTYNSAHRPASHTDASGNTASFTWNSAGQLTQVTDQGARVTKYAYDTLGRPTTIKRTISGTDQTLQTLAYTTNCGLPTYTTQPNCDLPATVTDSEGLVRTFQYDNLDRVKKVTYADATYEEYTYTDLDLTDARDRLNRHTTYVYNPLRWLSSVTAPVSSGVTRTTSYNYYRNGVLNWMTDANTKVTVWSTDLQARVTGKTYNNGASAGWTQTYDSAGRPLLRTDALGQTRTFAYNVDDTINSITYGSPAYTGVTTSNVSFTYDTYYPRVTSMTDGTGTTYYGYVDPNTGTSGAGHLLWEDLPGSGTDLDYGYDALNRIVSRTVEETGGNKTESWAYDVLDRVTSHVSELGTFTYGFNGKTPYPTSRSLTGTSIATAWAYDTNTNDRRLTSITNTPGKDFTNYAIDDGERITSLREVPGTSSAAYNLITPTQDDGDRLTSYVQQPKTSGGANTGTAVTWSYAYDKLDNFTSFTNAAASTTYTPSVNALNQQSGWAGTYSYDANGNMSSSPSATYKWDIENRLAEIAVGGNTIQFRYDGLGRRVKTITNGTEVRYLWSGDTIVHARDTSNAITRRYYAEGEHRPGSSLKLVYMTDHLGSVREVINAATGASVGTADYSPYGAVKTSTGTQADYAFAGLMLEPVSNHLLSKTRAYNGYIGKWLSRDSIEERGGLNLYGYVGGGPVSMVDSNGRFSIPAIASGLVVAAVTAAVVYHYVHENIVMPHSVNNEMKQLADMTKAEPCPSAEEVLKPGGKTIGTPAGSNKKTRELPGGLEAAEELYKKLSGGGTPHSDYPGTAVDLPGGGFVGIRPVSDSGPPTVDVQIPGVFEGKFKFK